MIKKGVIGLDIRGKNKLLIKMKTSLCKFNSNNIYINNKINPARQKIC